MRSPNIGEALRTADRLSHMPNPYEHIRTLAREVQRQREVMRSHGISDADAVDVDALHVHPFPGNVLQHVENMSEGASEDDSAGQANTEVRTDVTDLGLAMVVTSTLDAQTMPWLRDEDGGPLHRPVIDIDFPAKLLPSSTPGHYHLYLQRAIPWASYLRLLNALAEVGLVESGYAKVAAVRGHTAVRVPWFRKGDAAPVLPGTLGMVREPASALPWEA